MDHFDAAPADPAQLRLRLYPDPVLRQRARDIERVDERVQAAVAQMFRVMYQHEGIGLAGNQVGWLQRIFVVNLSSEPIDPAGELVFINPRVELLDGENCLEEGCLSLPDIRGDVRRPERVRVQALDRQGEPFELAADDLLARCVQHEQDHLDGILFLSRLTLTARMPLRRALKELERRYREDRKTG